MLTTVSHCSHQRQSGRHMIGVQIQRLTKGGERLLRVLHVHEG